MHSLKNGSNEKGLAVVLSEVKWGGVPKNRVKLSSVNAACAGFSALRFFLHQNSIFLAANNTDLVKFPKSEFFAINKLVFEFIKKIAMLSSAYAA